MNFIHHSIIDREKISFAINAMSGNNDHTTKHITALPSRHSLAIFTPTVSDNSPTSVNIPSLQDAYSITSYGGVMGVNTTPVLGNSPSRLCAVVQPCHPLSWAVKLTKHIGAFAMNAIITPFKSFHLSAIHSFLIGCLLGLPIACLVIAALWLMGV